MAPKRSKKDCQTKSTVSKGDPDKLVRVEKIKTELTEDRWKIEWLPIFLEVSYSTSGV